MFAYIVTIKLDSGAYVNISLVAKDFSDAISKAKSRSVVGVVRMGYKVVCDV